MIKQSFKYNFKGKIWELEGGLNWDDRPSLSWLCICLSAALHIMFHKIQREHTLSCSSPVAHWTGVPLWKNIHTFVKVTTSMISLIFPLQCLLCFQHGTLPKWNAMLAVHSLRNNHPLIRRKALAWSLGIGTLRVGIEVVARQEPFPNLLPQPQQ